MTSLQKPVSRASEKRAAKREAERRKRNVYSFVSARDGFKCRCCGTAVKTGGGLLHGGHHHEIRFRSMGGQIVSSNVVLVCSACHADIHAYRLMVTGDADGRITLEDATGRIWTA